MPISFASPLLLAAVAAVAVPLLVHLVRREERRGRLFPSLMFIRRTELRIRRRKTLRDPALLALRCLAIVLLALAFAGPELTRESRADPVAEPSRDTVLVVDRSYSMAHPGRWQAALAEARRRIDGLRPGDRMAIVAFDRSAALTAPLTGDSALLRRRLEVIEPGTGTRLSAGLDLATRVLREAGAAGGRIVLVSDLQRPAVAAVDRLYLDRGVALEIVPVDAPVGENAAIMSAAPVPHGTLDAGDPSLDVRLRNTGTGALTGVGLMVEVDGRAAHRRRIDLDSGEERSLRFPVVPARDRATPVRVVLGDDGLAADNEYHLVLTPDAPVSVGLLTDPGPPSATDPALYLERALGIALDPPIRILRRQPAAGGTRLPERADVLIADDAALGDEDLRQRVRRFVESGGGLLLIPADRSPSPPPAGDWPFVPPGLGELRRHPQPGLGVLLPGDTAEHPLWRRAEADLAAALAGTRVLLSRRFEAADDGSRVLARLGDGEPWLVEGRFGRGRTLLMTSGHTGDWGNLTVTPGFVPLLQELVRHLAGYESVPPAHTLGEVVDLRQRATPPLDGGRRPLPAADGPVTIELPGAGVRRLEEGSHLYRPPRTGLYQAHRADGRAPPQPFAVNVERSESLLAPASPEELEQRIVRRPPPAAPAPASSSDTGRAPLGWYLLAAALAVLWLESQVANRLSWRRQDTQAPAAAGGR